MSMRAISFTSICIAALAIASASSLLAGKPTPPPPPPPETIYQDRRADLGGWLDTKRNLIWGQSISAASGSSYSYDFAVGEAADYANVLADGSTWYHSESLRYDALGDQYASTNPTRAQTYYAKADDYEQASLDLAASAVVASQFTNWRMPTKDEAADALSKGYFTYTDTWGAFDFSPLPGLQPQLPNFLYWTSTTDRGTKNAWSFDPVAGTFRSITRDGSYIYAVAVRTYTP